MPTAERALLHRGGRPGTGGSLGLWHEGADDYAEACESLARAVGQAAGIRPGERVLSLGCGAGDELLLWVRAFGAAEVCGLERDASLAAAARARLARGTLPAGTRVRVLAGDAAALATLARPGADADAGLQPPFDRVVCVDAAYHFSPRAPFLCAVRALLRPGGRFALTDLTLGPPRRAGWRLLLRGAAALARVPLAELLPLPAQGARLREAGFGDVQALALDAAVLDGFARHVRAQGPRVARTALHPDWRRPALTARLIGPCRAAGLGYALLSGEATPSAVATASDERTALSSSGTPVSA
ncbi:MAG: SAM-dependent methyltransferase [Betaproteobacteria bacterium]